MAASSLAGLAPSEERQRLPISAIEALPGRLSAFIADRGARPAGPRAAVGTADGGAAALAVGAAAEAGTRLGWAGAASAAATATGAEESKHVQLISCARCRPGNLADARH